MSSGIIRVRFAPSPTGFLHVGGLRTALYNYLFARKNNGFFVLRIEDTDRSRFVAGAVDNLINTLKWAGLNFDEGPGTSGKSGPYVQSERLAIYRNHVSILLESGKAYRCFCTPERLDQMRKEQEHAGAAPKYDKHCLTHREESEQQMANGLPHVVRMNIARETPVKFNDIIRGEVEFSGDQIDDQVLLKSDGYPTYHLANVVDDHLMDITHVIRGEEWLSSTPKHVLLYQYFGWDMPAFAHLPLLLNADRSKLSKRQGDVAVEEYRSKGYLKEALINFVAFLGWNPGDERELFTLDELAKEFSLDRVGKSGAIFNIEKLDWLNFQHLRRMADVEVLRLLKAELLESPFRSISFTDKFLLAVIKLMRERVTFVKEYIEKSPYLFQSPDTYDQVIAKKRWTADSAAQMTTLAKHFALLHNPTASDYEKALHDVADNLRVSNGTLIHSVRLAVSGTGSGPGVYELLEVLGNTEVAKRINLAIDRLK